MLTQKQCAIQTVLAEYILRP